MLARDMAAHAHEVGAELPDARSLVRSVAAYESGRTDAEAGELETSNSPDDALVSWFREGVAFVDSYSGVVALMASAHADPDSALYAPCTAVHSAGARLLLRAQAEGTARADVDADDLFALMSALGWLVGQDAFAPRADHLLRLITSAIVTNPSSNDVKKATR